jgi:23S rRNA (cytidine2498-2'-O)-methyltransferase
LTEQDQRLHRLLLEACPHPEQLAEGAEHAFCPGIPGEYVLDCIVVEPDQWWIGLHRIKEKVEASLWPGGMAPLLSTTDAVSRAWWKFETCLRWSRFPIGCKTRCLDLGCAPGGASQALLGRGAEVLGVDPADVAPAVKHHPQFTHLRGKVGQIRRSHFRKARWILSDMNVAPTYTLEVLEDLLRHPQIRIRGILTTLKLFEEKQALQLEQYLAHFRKWGFSRVSAAQLQFHRREVVVAAR